MKRPRRRQFKNAAVQSDGSSESLTPVALELSRAAASGSLFASGMELARRAADGNQTVVLVEGISDQLALNALVGRLGWDAQAEGIAIVAMGGATISAFPGSARPPRVNVQMAGLCDRGEKPFPACARARRSRRGPDAIGNGSARVLYV